MKKNTHSIWDHSHSIVQVFKKKALQSTAGKIRYLEILGPDIIASSSNKKASLKEFYSNMTRLEKYLKNPLISTARFVQLESNQQLNFSELFDAFKKTKISFNTLMKNKNSENTVKLFDNLEKMRVFFGSDFKVICGKTYHGQTLLISALIANMRQACMHVLIKDRAFIEFAKNARTNVAKYGSKIAVFEKDFKQMQQKFTKNPNMEFSGGAKIVIEKGVPTIKFTFLNKQQFYWDNPVIIEPLIKSKSDFYFHSHPRPVSFTEDSHTNGRWNRDIETAKTLDLPFLLFAGNVLEIFNQGKINIVKII